MAELSAKASNLPQAANWLTYPYLMYVRYPHLRPPQDDKTFWQTLEKWETRIASHPKAKRALKNLNPELRQQLAALLVDIIADLETYKPKLKQRLKAVAREAKRRARMLRRKRAKARRALNDWRRYAVGLDPLLAGEDEETAKRCLKLLDEMPEYPDVPSPVFLVPGDPTVRAMVELYWFFRSGCSVSGDEAEVRVGVLRNASWTEYGSPKVKLRGTYRTGESKACQAVHDAVRRFRPHQGAAD